MGWHGSDLLFTGLNWFVRLMSLTEQKKFLKDPVEVFSG